MLIQFNDNTTLEILSFELDAFDKNVLNIHLEVDKNKIFDVKEIFKNKEKTSLLICEQNELKGFNKLTRFYINALNDDVYDIDVQLVYEGFSAEVDRLKEELANSNEQIEVLSQCLLEIGDILYQ